MPRLPIDEYRGGEMHTYIVECLRLLGKTFDHCEQCDKRTTKLDVHHTKYDGATIYDLELVCRACNLKAENKYLD